MPLLHRLTRAVSADLHALLDRVEDPATLLQQALRELRAEVDRTRATLARIDDRAAARGARLERIDGRLGALDQQIDLCLAEAREDLARAVVREKLAARADREREAARLGADRRERERLAALLGRRRETLRGLEERAAAAEPEPAGAGEDRPPSSGPPGARICDAEVEVALLAEIAARRAP